MLDGGQLLGFLYESILIYFMCRFVYEIVIEDPPTQISMRNDPSTNH